MRETNCNPDHGLAVDTKKKNKTNVKSVWSGTGL